MTAENLAQAYSSTASILSNVKASQLDGSTPCASWTVRGLINHLVGGTAFFASAAETGTAAGGEEQDFSAGDYNGAFAAGSARVVAAFSAGGAMEKPMKLPFGEMPGAIVANIAATDVFAHGWDLAKATGQSTDINPELAAEMLAGARMMIQDAMRGADGQAPFGPVVAVPESAPIADQLAGFLGRQV